GRRAVRPRPCDRGASRALRTDARVVPRERTTAFGVRPRDRRRRPREGRRCRRSLRRAFAAAQLRPPWRKLTMGLFTGLLLLPLAPLRGTIWLAEQLAAIAEQEL